MRLLHTPEIGDETMIRERDFFKTVVNPEGFAPGGVSYKLSTISKDGVLLVQPDATGTQAQGLTSIDDIIVQTAPVPVSEPPHNQCSPHSGARNFYSGLLGTVSASAITSGTLLVGIDPIFVATLLPMSGAFVTMMSTVFNNENGKSTLPITMGAGLCTSVVAAGMAMPSTISTDLLMMITGATFSAVSITCGGLALHECSEAYRVSSGRKLAAGVFLGCLAGMAMSAFAAVAAVEPETQGADQNRATNKRVEMHMDRTPPQRTAPRLD
jgi:hypothetical protein